MVVLELGILELGITTLLELDVGARYSSSSSELDHEACPRKLLHNCCWAWPQSSPFWGHEARYFGARRELGHDCHWAWPWGSPLWARPWSSVFYRSSKASPWELGHDWFWVWPPSSPFWTRLWSSVLWNSKIARPWELGRDCRCRGLGARHDRARSWNTAWELGHDYRWCGLGAQLGRLLIWDLNVVILSLQVMGGHDGVTSSSFLLSYGKSPWSDSAPFFHSHGVSPWSDSAQFFLCDVTLEWHCPIFSMLWEVTLEWHCPFFYRRSPWSDIAPCFL